MHRLTALILVVPFFGCVTEPRPPYQPVPVAYDNPVMIPIASYELVWEGVRDIVAQNFRIEHEEPLRPIGNSLFPGRIDTFPMPGATLLEPWYHDSANEYERLECTLQSIRRYSVVKVIPAQNGGFWVDVAVFKELENVKQPERATAGSATFRTDATLPSRLTPEQTVAANQNWIPQGHDTAAEQRIIGQILDRFTPQGTPLPVN
jgi:hypothetical protein